VSKRTGRSADQLCQVRLKVLELGGTDLPLPLIAQLVEDRFTCAHDLEAERGDLKAFAAGVARVGTACHVSALLQHRDGFRRRLLGDRQTATQFRGVSAPAAMARMAKSWTGRTSS
jgi:hypothetical protein